MSAPVPTTPTVKPAASHGTGFWKSVSNALVSAANKIASWATAAFQFIRDISVKGYNATKEFVTKHKTASIAVGAAILVAGIGYGIYRICRKEPAAPPANP